MIANIWLQDIDTFRKSLEKARWDAIYQGSDGSILVEYLEWLKTKLSAKEYTRTVDYWYKVYVVDKQ